MSERSELLERLGRVGVWTNRIDELDRHSAVRTARKIEALGYGSLWVPEVLGREIFANASLLLEGTDQIIVGTGVANIWARDPVAMQNGNRTLAEAFPGRFILGMGVSHRPIVERGRGHKYERPLRTIREYLERMDAAPYYAAAPPIDPTRVLGALGPQMLELAGTRADGAHPYLVTPAHTRSARAILGPDALLIPEAGVLTTTDNGRAAEIAREHLAVYLRLPNYLNNLRRLGFDDADFADGGSDRLIGDLFVTSEEERVGQRISEHLAAGADHVTVQLIGPADFESELERLGPVASSF